nr:hypothetical transcript [Hymenolepis microstoma]
MVRRRPKQQIKYLPMDDTPTPLPAYDFVVEEVELRRGGGGGGGWVWNSNNFSPLPSSTLGEQLECWDINSSRISSQSFPSPKSSW